MSTAFTEFTAVVRDLTPTSAIVLGSGLGGITNRFRESASIDFSDIPGLVPTTVLGHRGRLAVGVWSGVPSLLYFGRLHYYEGHSPEVVTTPVRTAAKLGVTRLILTNAAGGIHHSLGVGSLMAIRGHIKLIGPNAWRQLTDSSAIVTPYSPRFLALMPNLLAGRYAALTGPCYETAAEIRALATAEVDAVGMSTAMEAEAAAELGLEVAGISCITNKAAGLSPGPLHHAEVMANAKSVVERLAELVGRLISSS